VAHVITSSRKNSYNMRFIWLFPPFLCLYIYFRVFVSFRASLGTSVKVREVEVEVEVEGEVEVEDFAARLLNWEGV